jgi:hypothetical protein
MRIKKQLSGFEQFSFDITDIIVEGKRAAVELEINGAGPGNEAYENTYMMWIVTDEKAEKIKSIKQTLDCYRVEVWVESKD